LIEQEKTMEIEYTIETSIGGRSTRGTQKNGFAVTTPLAISDAGALTIGQEIVAALRAGAPSSLHFMNLFYKRLARQGVVVAPNDFVTKELAGVGDRVLADPTLPRDHVLQIIRDTGGGRSGRLNLRGFVTDAEVNVTPGNQYTLANPAVFTTGGAGVDSLIERLNAGVSNGTLIIPANNYFFTGTYRPIVSHVLRGVGLSSSTRQRVSVQTAEQKLNQRKLNEFGAKARKLEKQYLESGNAGSLLALLVSLAEAAFAFYTGLPILVRAALAIPSVLRGRGGF
jgi:hypothetical protein